MTPTHTFWDSLGYVIYSLTSCISRHIVRNFPSINCRVMNITTYRCLHSNVYISYGPRAGYFTILFLPHDRTQQVVLTECSLKIFRRRCNVKKFIILLTLAAACVTKIYFVNILTARYNYPLDNVAIATIIDRH